MRTVSLEEAQMHLGELLDAAQEGDQFLISRNGEPLAELTKKGTGPAVPDRTEATARKALGKRKLGLLADKMTVPDDFDSMFQAEIEEMFYGEE